MSEEKMDMNFDAYRVEEIDPSTENLETVLNNLWNIGWKVVSVNYSEIRTDNSGGVERTYVVVLINRALTEHPIK